MTHASKTTASANHAVAHPHRAKKPVDACELSIVLPTHPEAENPGTLEGESKLSLKERLNYLIHLCRVLSFRYGTSMQAISFACVGASGIIVDLGCLYSIQELVPFTIARVLAIWIAMTWNFFWNRTITFSHSRSEKMWGQYVKFCLSCLAGAMINLTISGSMVLNGYNNSHQRLIAAACGVLGGFVFNFVVARNWAFRKHSP